MTELAKVWLPIMLLEDLERLVKRCPTCGGTGRVPVKSKKRQSHERRCSLCGRLRLELGIEEGEDEINQVDEHEKEAD